MNRAETFINAVLNEASGLDAIDDFIDEWHESDSSQPLSTFLGMTEEEYGAWVVEPFLLEEIVETRRNGREFRRVPVRSV